MIEIRIHGRGGQGVVTSAHILAIAGFYEGFYTQAFPVFGAERRGAPVEGYVRLDKEPILTRAPVENPDYVLVLDDSLLKTVDVFEGIKKKGIVIINSAKSPEEIETPEGITVKTIDLNEIALKMFGKPIVNTLILAAFAKYTGLISKESLIKAVRERLADKGEKVINKNIEAINLVFEK